MNELLGLYPLWYVPDFGSANVIAVTASTHVLFSHTAVGASFLLAYLATKAYKDGNDELFDYVKKYIFGLLITSYIIGSITGPGIWFTTTVANPRGISTLIHNFVWAWAAEWVWFVTEVVLVYVLYYIYKKVDRKTYMHMTWIFAGASFMTMMLIVGILSFMLSPGNDAWFQTGNILDGFYNKNYFPHVLMRGSFMVALAGLMGIAVASRLKNVALRTELFQKLSLWGIGGTIFGTMFFLLYVQSMPERAFVTLDFVISPAFKTAIASMITIVILFFIYIYMRSHTKKHTTPVVVLMLVVLVLALYPEEKIRETLRKPFVAGEFVYVNQIISRDVPGQGIKSEIDHINENGLIASYPFAPENVKTVTPDNVLQVGETVAKLQCSYCHSIDAKGPRPLVQKLDTLTDPEVIYNFVSTRMSGHPDIGGAPYMPELVGTEEERRALSVYLADMNKKHLEGKDDYQFAIPE